MFKSLSKPGVASEAVSGKSGGDLLLKELQNLPLDEWKGLRILYEHPHPGVQEHVCNRLPELGEATLERYLLQLVYLAVNKPGQHLERIILLLCARSFRIAIKTQWLLVALCQDHPKNKALEAFRDQAYKAALEGKWEVPIRSAKLDPLSPNSSAQFSPQFCSPTNSYLTAHFASVGYNSRDVPQSQPYRMPAPGCLDTSVAIQPPSSMVMSPPAVASSAGLGAAIKRAADASSPAALQRRSNALTCLLPPEQRGGGGTAIAATAGTTSSTAAPQQQQHSKETDAAGSSGAWLDESAVSAMVPAIRTSPPAAVHCAVAPAGVSDAAITSGTGALAAPPAPATPAMITSGPPPLSAAVAAVSPAPIAAAAAARSAGPVGHAAIAGSTGSSVFSTGVGATIADRIQALRRELGEGEGVSALLERAKQQGMATVAAPDDDALLSDDELANRPMSPLSRLRFDTFGATLDFVETLCDASSSLTNYSQEERQRALRVGLDHINGEIEKANRREVAIWFPMGRRGDRVLGIAAKEAVLLNSREKAPFMLFVEVLEGQNECGDEGVGADAFVDLTASATCANVKARLESLCIGGDVGGLSSSMMAANSGPKLEFGRRETYGIALTGIGAQHQLQFMHAAPGGAAARQPHHGTEHKGQVDSSMAKRCVADVLAHSRAAADATLPATAAAPAGPCVSPPLVRAQGSSDALLSPMPTRPASSAHASRLEEHAATLARRSPATAAAEAAGEGTVRGSGAGSPAPTSEIFIPTRSASSNNIAAAAAAAMAASASGGGSDSVLAASARSSEAGSAVGAAHSSGGGGLPQTPRSGGSSLSGLPPRPPSLSLSSSQQQQLPLGGISPINAAKEVSCSNAGGAEGGGLLSSNLLRRILGDRGPEGGSGEGQAGLADASRFFTIASAAGPPSVPSSLATPPMYPHTGPKPPQAREPGLTGPVGTGWRNAAPPPRLSGVQQMMDGKLQELAALGASLRGSKVPAFCGVGGRRRASCGEEEKKETARGGGGERGVFSPHSQGKADPEVMEVLSNISASLRGEMPMVRVKILPLGPGAAAAGAGGNCASGCGGGGGNVTSSSFAGLGRVKAALLNQPLPPQQQATVSDAAEGGQNKTMVLLSRLGLRRKPAAEDDAGADVAAAAAAASGAAQVTIPVSSSSCGAATAKQRPAGQLVRLVLFLPTQSLNLDIKSPHRKSRRTPSHEAIEMMADKYKVLQLPPPPDFGPPLCPGPYGGYSGSIDRVIERPSEEGEGTAEDEAEGTALEGGGGATAGAAPPPEQQQQPAPAVTAAAVAPVSVDAEVAGASAAVLGPPLPPEWEARSPRAVRCQRAELAPPAPWAATHPPGPTTTRSGGGCSGGGGVEMSAGSASRPFADRACLVSPPTAVAEATSVAADAVDGWAPMLDKPPMETGLGAMATSGPIVAARRMLGISAQQSSTSDTTPAGSGIGTADSLSYGVWDSAGSLSVPAEPQPLPHAPAAQQSRSSAVTDAASLPPPPVAAAAAAILQSPLTRILSRSPAGQQPSASESAAPSASNTVTGPRGVSPVRGGGVWSRYASAVVPPGDSRGAEGDGNGPAAAQLQQRASGAVAQDGGPGAAAPSSSSSSSVLAASLQSLTRILNRSQQQQQSSGETSSPASASSGGAMPPGHSPRGVSPVRGAGGAATAGQQQQLPAGDAAPPAASSATNRLSKLLGRLQLEQQPQQAPATPQPQQAPGPQLPGQGHPMPMPPGRLRNGMLTELTAADVAAAQQQQAPPRSLPYGLPKVTDGRYERESLEERRRREAVAVYGERWASRVKRIQRESPHGRRKGWALRCVIVKSGDDCRQELLALQLVRTFGDIFTEAGLPLWVRYYEVLVTSNKTALIEMVPNTLSIHTIKSRSPPGTSLSDHFFAKFGRSGTPECTAAQRRFTESLAAYSLICYLLQIKDRHNGNILVDDDGRVVHIDYGFLLSNSPGGVNFESAPFKLTRELLEVMDSNSDGRPSEMFDYFKVLMIQGFIAVRTHSDRILLLAKLMAKSGFPCFKGGERALKALEKRLMASLSEVQCVEHVLQLIAESLDAWRTRQYDYYQRVLNGIL